MIYARLVNAQASKCAEKFRKNIVSFQDGDVKDLLFDAILYGFLFKFSENSMVSKKRSETFLEKNFLINLSPKKALFR